MVPTLISIAITLALSVAMGFVIAVWVTADDTCDAADESWLDWDGEVPAELQRGGRDELTMPELDRLEPLRTVRRTGTLALADESPRPVASDRFVPERKIEELPIEELTATFVGADGQEKTVPLVAADAEGSAPVMQVNTAPLVRDSSPASSPMPGDPDEEF